MLAEDPALADGLDAVDPVVAVDQMLRRALRVGPASGSDPIDSDTWSAAGPVASDFWEHAAARPRRTAADWWTRRRGSRSAGRARSVAAMVLVAALAAGWIATSEVGHGPSRAPVAAPAAPASPRVRATVSPNRSPGVPATSPRLRDVVPAGATCGYGPASANQAHCTVSDVQVAYSRLDAADLRAGYVAAVGSVSPPAAGEPACANGAEDERSWSRPASPRRAVGRYACRIEQGRAAMWWTVDDRGLLAHATAAGADLASLFAWWTSHAER